MRATGRTAFALDARGTGRADFGHGHLLLNVGERARVVGDGAQVPAGAWALRFEPGLDDLRPMSRASNPELARLFADQASIIVREFLFKGRPVNTNQWLAAERIELENPDRW